MKNRLKSSRKPSIGGSKVTRTYTGIAWAVVAVTSVTIALCVAASATNPVKPVFRPPDSEAQLTWPKPMSPQVEAIISNLVNRGVTANQSVEMADRVAAGLDPVPDPTEGIAQSAGLQSEKIQAGNKAIAQVVAQGSGANNSQFVYDPFNRIVKIIETRNGTATSTKQFVWANSTLCEERDGSGNLTKQFFALGQTISGTPYYYTRDQINSVREMTDSSGNVVAQYSYTPDGQVTKVKGNTVDSDFLYAGMYDHQPSRLNLAVRRGYYPILGRWLNRDPIGEFGGLNLYAYVGNQPISRSDPSGLAGGGATGPILGPFGWGPSGPTWGNWGGWNYVNGTYGGGEFSPFPGSGARGSGGHFNGPIDPTDMCFYWHDVCLNLGARIRNPSGRQCWRRDCDQHLAHCLARSWSPLAPAFTPLFGLTPPNNNASDPMPGLGPDPTAPQ